MNCGPEKSVYNLTCRFLQSHGRQFNPHHQQIILEFSKTGTFFISIRNTMTGIEHGITRPKQRLTYCWTINSLDENCWHNIIFWGTLFLGPKAGALGSGLCPRPALTAPKMFAIQPIINKSVLCVFPLTLLGLNGGISYVHFGLKDKFWYGDRFEEKRDQWCRFFI